MLPVGEYPFLTKARKLKIVANAGSQNISTDSKSAVSPRILLVDDDEITASNITYALTGQGYSVEWVTSGEDAVIRAVDSVYDAIILDRMLPGIDGLMTISALRNNGCDSPIIMLSALATIENRVEGLDAGAQDYLVKPFAMAELIARLNATLRDRRNRKEGQFIRYHDLVVDRIKKVASVKGEVLNLLPKEFEMLTYFAMNIGQVITRQMLLETLWGYKFETGTNVIDVHVSRLRKKLEAVSDGITIRAERGVGYRLVQH